MEIRCPYCEKTVEVPGGGQFACPNCRAIFAVDMEPGRGAPPSAPPGAPPLPPPMPPTQPTVPSGGAPICARHPGVVAYEACSRCGNFMCGECVTLSAAGTRVCPSCFALGPAPGSIPWEVERAQIGMMAAWWRTAKQVAFSPDEFFRRMPPQGIEPALGFNVLGATIFGIISQCIIFGIMALIGSAAGGGNQVLAAFAVHGPIQLACTCVFLPIMAAVGLFITAAIYHVIALICGGGGTFETTLRIIGYGAGSTQWLNVVPYLGALVAGFWNMYVCYYGFLHGHKMSSGRALMVVVAPVLIGICCVGIFFVAFSAAIFAALQQVGPR